MIISSHNIRHEWTADGYCTQCNTYRASEPDDYYDSDNDLWDGEK